MVAHHADHVEEDEAHDDHVELLVGDDPEDDSLRSPRRPGKSLQRLLGARLLHGGDVLLLVLGHEGVQAAALVLLLIELVDDDTDQEVEGEEGSEHDEGHEEEVAHHTVLVHGLLVQLELEEQIRKSLPDGSKSMSCLTPTLSTASSMMSIQPLNVAIWNKDR